jgi:hypothetical protein
MPFEPRTALGEIMAATEQLLRTAVAFDRLTAGDQVSSGMGRPFHLPVRREPGRWP